jgi:hypothetical protein
VIHRLETVVVEENDVCRIEAATTHFLAELKEALEGIPTESIVSTRLLQ